MSSLLLDEPVSPELVLVAPPELAVEAREALPDYERDFHAWVEYVRGLMDPDPVLAADGHERGTLLFVLFVCLNAIAPLAFIIVWRTLA